MSKIVHVLPAAHSFFQQPTLMSLGMYTCHIFYLYNLCWHMEGSYVPSMSTMIVLCHLLIFTHKFRIQIASYGMCCAYKIFNKGICSWVFDGLMGLNIINFTILGFETHISCQGKHRINHYPNHWIIFKKLLNVYNTIFVHLQIWYWVFIVWLYCIQR